MASVSESTPGMLRREPDGPCEINPDGPGSPIVIATESNSAYKLTSAAKGVLFDLNSGGVPEWINTVGT